MVFSAMGEEGVGGAIGDFRSGADAKKQNEHRKEQRDRNGEEARHNGFERVYRQLRARNQIAGEHAGDEGDGIGFGDCRHRHQHSRPERRGLHKPLQRSIDFARRRQEQAADAARLGRDVPDEGAEDDEPPLHGARRQRGAIHVRRPPWGSSQDLRFADRAAMPRWREFRRAAAHSIRCAIR